MPSEPDHEPQSSPEIEILNSNCAENTEISVKEKEKKKKKPSVAPLKLESLLKSFFAEEIRDLSCEKCNFPSSKAKVRRVGNKIEKRSGRRRIGGRSGGSDRGERRKI